MSDSNQPDGSNKSTGGGGGGCPVKMDENSPMGSSAWKWLGNVTAKEEKAKQPEGCSVASIEESAKHAQIPQPDQRVRLDTTRQVSSIPRSTGAAMNIPHHQHDDSESNWVYPSEQQLYNAMRKKGWSNIPEDSIPVVLQIHNAVNEGTWQKICRWEGTDQIRLVKFQGRPRELTPKAFVYSKILRLYPVPFDRHDWYVAPETSVGQTPDTEPPLQRYVIDYYMQDHPTDPNVPPMTHIDVRPALDGSRGFYLRGMEFFQASLPGITGYLQRRAQQQQQQPKDSSA